MLITGKQLEIILKAKDDHIASLQEEILSLRCLLNSRTPVVTQATTSERPVDLKPIQTAPLSFARIKNQLERKTAKKGGIAEPLKRYWDGVIARTQKAAEPQTEVKVEDASKIG